MKTDRSFELRRGLALLSVALCALDLHAQEKVTFQDHIAPLIESHCGKCHNPDKKKGDLDLSSYNALLQGGASGQSVSAGSADSSKMFRAITHAEEPTMPPNKKLPDKDIALFKRWIDGGMLENSGSKAAAPKATVDLALKAPAVGKPEGPPAIPAQWPRTVSHAAAGTAVTGLAASPWAPVIAVAHDKQLFVYQSETMEQLGSARFAHGVPVDIKFSRSGKLLIIGGGTAAQSGRVSIVDVVSGKEVSVVGKEYDSVLASDLSPDQQFVALGGPDRLVKIYEVSTGEVQHKIKKHTDWVTALAFSPDGEKLATADRNGGVALWDADNAQELSPIAGHKSATTSLSWRPDGKLFATSSEDGTVKVWNADDGKQVRSWDAHKPGVQSVSYTADGKLVSCGRDNLVTLWDANGGKIRSYPVIHELPTRAVVSHDGSQVIAANWSGRMNVWNAATTNLLFEVQLHKNVVNRIASPAPTNAVQTAAR